MEAASWSEVDVKGAARIDHLITGVGLGTAKSSAKGTTQHCRQGPRELPGGNAKRLGASQVALRPHQLQALT